VKRAVRRAASLAAVALIAACAQFEPRPPDGPLEFQLAGRLAARYSGESFTGNVTWSHARQGDEMLISSPLGQGVVRTAEPREYRADDAETLTQKVLGFRLPLLGLGDWVRARPSADSPAVTQHNDNGTLKLLEQRGWRIEYLEYDGVRPRLMRLVYPGIELRFAVTEWK
jgi:outer membrane lipoprotein LolB